MLRSAAALLLAPLLAQAPTTGDLRADLDLLATELPKLHKNLFWRMPQAEWEARVARLRGSLAELTFAQFVAGAMELVAAAGDGHTTLTWVTPHTAATFRICPLAFEVLADGILVVAAPDDQAAVLGQRLVAIDGHALEDVLAGLRPIIAHDNDAGFANGLRSTLLVADLLHARGLADGTESLRLGLQPPGGEPHENLIHTVPVREARRLKYARLERELPLCATRPEQPFWYEYIAENQTLYLKYNACRDGEKFATMLQEMWAGVAEQPVARFVVDLRDNGGGNSALFRPLLQQLRERETLNRRGHLFGIVGPRTFSSAVLNALELQAQTNVILAGTATGGKPNHYGEVKVLALPRTRLAAQYSTKYFRCVEGDPDAVQPDLLVPTTIADYQAGRDPVLAAVLAWKQ